MRARTKNKALMVRTLNMEYMNRQRVAEHLSDFKEVLHE